MIVATYPKNEIGKKFARKDITNNIPKIQIINCINLEYSIRFGFHKDKALLEQLAKYINNLYQSKISAGLRN